MRQSQIEKTMNLNMSCQTILTRLFATQANDKNDHDTFLKGIFEMVNIFLFILIMFCFKCFLTWCSNNFSTERVSVSEQADSILNGRTQP